MAEAIYVLCGLTSLASTVLLWRAYRTARTRLLLWSGLCFALLTVNNAILFVDLVVLPSIDLSLARNASALVAIAVLLFGLVWERR
jgi:hypothetical protein